MTDYNGWINRDTWALNLHMSNNEGDYLFFRELARECLEAQNLDFDTEQMSESDKQKAIWQFEEKLKEWYNEIRDNVISKKREYEPTEEAVMLILDCSDDNDVNYHEIAKNWIIDELNETAFEIERRKQKEAV